MVAEQSVKATASERCHGRVGAMAAMIENTSPETLKKLLLQQIKGDINMMSSEEHTAPQNGEDQPAGGDPDIDGTSSPLMDIHDDDMPKTQVIQPPPYPNVQTYQMSPENMLTPISRPGESAEVAQGFLVETLLKRMQSNKAAFESTTPGSLAPVTTTLQTQTMTEQPTESVSGPSSSSSAMRSSSVPVGVGMRLGRGQDGGGDPEGDRGSAPQGEGGQPERKTGRFTKGDKIAKGIREDSLKRTEGEESFEDRQRATDEKSREEAERMAKLVDDMARKIEELEEKLSSMASVPALSRASDVGGSTMSSQKPTDPNVLRNQERMKDWDRRYGLPKSKEEFQARSTAEHVSVSGDPDRHKENPPRAAIHPVNVQER